MFRSNICVGPLLSTFRIKSTFTNAMDGWMVPSQYEVIIRELGLVPQLNAKKRVSGHVTYSIQYTLSRLDSRICEKL